RMHALPPSWLGLIVMRSSRGIVYPGQCKNIIPLTVQLRRDNVDAPQHRDDIADHVPFNELWKDLIIDVARGARADAPGNALARADDVVAKLPAGRFDAVVDFAHRRFEAAVGHDQLEVMNQPFNAAV